MSKEGCEHMRITKVIRMVPIGKTPKKKSRELPVYRYHALVVDKTKGTVIDVKG